MILLQKVCIEYGFWNKGSAVSSICSLSCEKSERNWHPHRQTKAKTLRAPENIAAVAESVCEAASTSIHRRAQQLNISATSLRQILHKYLGMMPHKIQLVQELKPIDHPMRFRFAKWACDRLGKKNYLFRWSSFWFWRVCKQAQLSNYYGALYRAIHFLVPKVWDNISHNAWKMIKTYYKNAEWSVDGNFLNKIFCSAEAHFTLCGYVNK